MDQQANLLPDLISNYKFDDEIVLPSYDESPTLLNGGLKFRDYPLELNLLDSTFSPDPGPGLGLGPANNLPISSSNSSEVESPDDGDSDPVLRYLNQILLEENMEEKPSMFHDPLALQAAEKSFYDALGQNYPLPAAYQHDHNAGSPDSLFGVSSEYSTNSSTTVSSSIDPGEHISPSGGQSYSSDSFQSASQINPTNMLFSSPRSFGSSLNNGRQMDSFGFSNMIPNIFSDSESILQFQKGMEEARKFLPTGNPLSFDLDKYALPPKSSDDFSRLDSQVKIERGENEESSSIGGSKGKKHLHRQESDLGEQRISKQSAVYVEEAELSEMFDKVLLCKGEGACEDMDSMGQQGNLNLNGASNGKAARTRNQGSNQTEAVDLRTLLISCAQSVAADDRRTATEQLKQIRQHSSSTGDAYQRLARLFANGLEARMAGTGTEVYASLASKRISAAEKLKAYQVYLSACPFKKIAIFFTNKMIQMKASNAKTLHIVDFGINYGFQWPMLIQQLSSRAGGPPKLRITGIERPQPGFRPSERVEETGRRLARYCERFSVPFEYNAIALQNWETLTVEDLNLVEGEYLAVSCLFQFNDLLDETVIVDSPRDAVLRLIRKMNPDIFVNSASNGAYSAPFFVTRFREALFHYSSLFDIFEATLPRDCPERLNFEQEFYGREAINVIACEGPERVVRPETYKQWHVRHTRAGFKPLPLDPEVMKKLRAKTKAGYHKDFVFDEDGNWMLQGWKGRIIYASSCWIPA
ncbi:OLC1v1007647C1 [Oldenlandia corymbosa var. corymbosa]|uniref:OLC1v1007647C1 n=1 Tax=Oldenlandia corymbosa var. corymbosa TaxID=529605 RepID=A0AAV1DM65_OLDCO|nr:OLC1v1007647C1 [Oldenlandia corymbosa var. corymbosa]